MLTRRGFLKMGGAIGIGGALASCAGSPPFRQNDRLLNSLPFGGLVTSLRQEHDYYAAVTGRLPEDLQGTLYRNGPGLFDRGGLRKRSVLDGDGMIQAFTFGSGRVRYRNRFVRTDKFIAEEREGRFRYATWSTQAPGGPLANLFGLSMADQAGVTVVCRGNSLYAFDEATTPFELDPATLITRGRSDLGLKNDRPLFAAHSKMDAESGDWVLFGLSYGLDATLYLTTLRKGGHSQRRIHLPRRVYLHDFFVTSRHVLFYLHPAFVQPVSYLLGVGSLLSSLSWRPEEGGLLLVVEREGTAAPLILETEPAWMWHGLNAFENGVEIVADLVAYAAPDHFLGLDAPATAMMEGRPSPPVAPGELRRLHIDLRGRRVREEKISCGDHEFPFVNPRLACRRHRFGYLTTGKERGTLPTGISRIDTERGSIETFSFGAGIWCGEPVFVPRLRSSGDSQREEGWLLSEGYDSADGCGFLAILDAERVADGPLATVRLAHHAPFSFHGTWKRGADG